MELFKKEASGKVKNWTTVYWDWNIDYVWNAEQEDPTSRQKTMKRKR